jgi:hypothetical protein
MRVENLRSLIGKFGVCIAGEVRGLVIGTSEVGSVEVLRVLER